MRIALLGPLAPWRGGLAQYLALLGESLMAHAEVRGVTFTRQYPGLLFPGRSQLDPAAERPRFPVESRLDSVLPWTWRRTARALEAFAPGAVVLKWWMPFFGPAFASAVGPLRRRGTRVVLVCDNLVPHERRPFDAALTRWMLRNSDGYLVMSESVERDLGRLKPGAPYRRVAEAAGGEEAVRMRAGYLPDEEVEALFKAADVAVLPYRSATQSGVTHVAYAMGVPVITTRVGGLAETVIPGGTGLVVPPEDPETLAGEIVRFFEERLGERMRIEVAALAQRHSWEALAGSTVELIDALAPARGWR